MAARCRENWPYQLVNNFRQKFSELTAAGCSENSLKKIYFFTAIRQSYMTLVSKKKPRHSRQQGAVKIGPTDWSIILVKKSTALTGAGFRENKLRKVRVFKAIRHSYKT